MIIILTFTLVALKENLPWHSAGNKEGIILLIFISVTNEVLLVGGLS